MRSLILALLLLPTLALADDFTATWTPYTGTPGSICPTAAECDAVLYYSITTNCVQGKFAKAARVSATQNTVDFTTRTLLPLEEVRALIKVCAKADLTETACSPDSPRVSWVKPALALAYPTGLTVKQKEAP